MECIKNIEMHCHSTLSDGRNTQGEVINEAKRLDLDFLALTDHDVVASQDFQSSLKSEGINTCDSVEISARNFDLNKSLHLVSYARIFHQSLHDILQNSRNGKMKMKWGQFESLISRHGFAGTREDFDDYMRTQLGREPVTSNKYDMSRYLYSVVSNGDKMKEILGALLRSDDIVGTFYLECLKREGSLYDTYGFESEEYEPSVEDTVGEVVNKAGGIVSLAHPNVTFGDNKGGIPEFERTMGDYVEKGINGVEINSIASHEWIQSILKVRRKYDLILTFGSDCHNIGKTDSKHSTIGRINPFVETDLFENNIGEFQALVA